MDRFAMFFLAGLGVILIYTGYALFCGLPALGGRRRFASRAGVLLLNVIPGILLALLGTGLLTAQVRGILIHKPAPEQLHQPGQRNTSWHSVSPRFWDHSA